MSSLGTRRNSHSHSKDRYSSSVNEDRSWSRYSHSRAGPAHGRGDQTRIFQGGEPTPQAF